MSASVVCSKAIHAALVADESAWLSLKLIGHTDIEADEFGPAERLELRNCACGSTISKSVAPR